MNFAKTCAKNSFDRTVASYEFHIKIKQCIVTEKNKINKKYFILEKKVHKECFTCFFFIYTNNKVIEY